MVTVVRLHPQSSAAALGPVAEGLSGADKALLAAFSENTHTVRSKHIDAAVRDSEFSQQFSRRGEARGLWRGAALVAAGAVLGIGLYVTAQKAAEPPVAAASRSSSTPNGRSVPTMLVNPSSSFCQ